jgi:hypothetical protein
MLSKINVKGVKDVQRALFKYNTELGVRVTRFAMKTGANYMKGHLKANTPVASGLTKKSVRAYDSKIHGHKKDGIISVWVGWRLGTGRRLLRGKESKAVPYYIGWVEYGYNKGSKRAGVKSAEALGLLRRGTASVRRVIGFNNRRLSRSSGRSGRVRQSRLYVRYGGKHVKGQFFMTETFDRFAERSAILIVDASNAIAENIARQLGLARA